MNVHFGEGPDHMTIQTRFFLFGLLLFLDNNHSVGKYISHIDPTYSSLFMDSVWKDVFEKPDSNAGLLNSYIVIL